MPLFTALQTLRQQLSQVTGCRSGYAHFTADASAERDSLAWLASQPHWPKFFWQSREGNESLAACGALNKADSPAQAAQRLQTLPPGWKLVGANAFGAESLFFMPRLLWQGGHVTVFIQGDLAKDARRAIEFIDGLVPARPQEMLPPPTDHMIHTPGQADWTHLVTRALAAITGGALDKVVLARATDLHFSSAVSPAALLAASRAINPHCYHFMLASGPQDAFVGSSPERLYLRQHQQMQSEALAGTCAGSADDGLAYHLAQKLLADEKNQRENLMVVADIRQRLQPIAGQIHVAPVEVVRLRNVQHLRRKIHCALRVLDDAACLAQLQPTAAVAGLPRQPARRFLQEHEPFQRGWYAGSVGYLSLAESEFAVALRSAQVTGDRVRLYAGAGIVAGSQASEEWRELDQKAAGLGSLLGMHFAQ
ncbi:isochorismate synthase [Erwinia sp. P6884]|uniref:isochorismate synthase n=1 Tax=Erwinia sp. P6884 TaxID=3141450 RepID=UPI0031974A96